jgi:2-dehydro-3-deoxyphosphogluconate aldolase/(4S)-4-hydroxy-2-oxoglutarate aldolase
MMSEKQARLATLLEASPVIAVLVVDKAATAVPLARALVRGGVRILEITLRSTAALAAIEAIATHVTDAIVGAGTILSPHQFAEVESAGCRFAVSPGATPSLVEAAAISSVDWLPGAATASEMMTLLEHGYRIQKFFPAEAAGGVDYLRSLASPFPALRLCPTGGIDARNAATYLSLPNVLCVGGSWVAPTTLVRSGKWDEISALAREAVSALKKA